MYICVYTCICLCIHVYVYACAYVEVHSRGKDTLWFTLTLLRTKIVKRMEGDMSELMAMLLATFFQEGGNLAAGCLMHTAKGTFMLHTKVTAVVADEAALKQVWECKGASGTLLCMLCSNVVKRSSRCFYEL